MIIGSSTKGPDSVSPLTRRSALKLGGAGTAWMALSRPTFGFAQTPAVDTADTIVIDMVAGPDYLDPALARSVRDWSIVHSIFDSIVHLSDSGEIVPLAAKTFTQVDDLTLEVTLRSGLTFHDGSPVRSDAIRRGIEWVQASEGPAVGNFSIITSVEEVDDLTARIVTATPAAWLLSQLAVWHVLFPESMTTELFTSAPVGSGPYRFVSGTAADQIQLERNPDYTWPSPKGQPIAESVTYRFVPESVTRIADLSTGQANIAQAIPLDQFDAITDAGASIVQTPILGVSFLRIATDTAPFDDPRVCQALNHAIDVETIAQQLVATESHRIASLFPDPRGIGYDPDLEPFTYDPDRARQLLTEAGHENGFDVDFQFAAGERDDLMEAIAGQLAEVGINVTLVSTDLATFNSQWQDPAAAPIRFVSWRPVFDPHTLLSLLFLGTGPLSRYANPEADAIITAAAEDTDPESRASRYRDLAALMQEQPAAVYLWNLTSTYAVDDAAAAWAPRADEYVIPTSSSGEEA
jgi:peptide/nickel transport system substrate-binding protein